MKNFTALTHAMHRTFAAALLAALSGCGYTPPPETWYVPDRHISAADTATFARLYCECLPWRCEVAGAT